MYDRAALPDREMRELYLRLLMLDTLLHEIGHHVDFAAPDARGRWVNKGRWKREQFAEVREHRWAQELVVGYLEQTYPGSARALLEWIGYHGGVHLPLEKLLDQPTQDVFSTHEAIDWLIRDVDSHKSLVETRIGFATLLGYGYLYDQALQSLATVLAEEPGNLKALSLQTETYERLKRFDEAERVARLVISVDPVQCDAWEVLAAACEARGRWGELDEAASRIIDLSATEHHAPISALTDRGRARIELGDYTGAWRDIDTLTHFGRHAARDVDMLKALLLLHTGAYEQALIFVPKLPKSSYRLWQIILRAVRFEAAHALGRPDEAGELTSWHMTWLRERGYGEWADRLQAVRDALPHRRSHRS